MPGDKRRKVSLPKRKSKITEKDCSWSSINVNRPMLKSIQEAIDEWAPESLNEQETKLARIPKLSISIEQLIERLANRSIHCRITDDDDFFYCSFVSNRAGSGHKMRSELEVMRNRERALNEKRFGHYETNNERVQRLEREKAEAERKRKKRIFEARVNQMKIDFQSNPHLRFKHIKELGDKHNFRTTYVIELSKSVTSSAFQRSYPSIKFQENELHSPDSRCFYVGMTWHTKEERFHKANANHMWNKNGGKKAGVVRKHRLINDSKPFEKSIKSLHKLTNKYGYENKQRKGRKKSDVFEHYVAYSLYMCGFRTWGPKFSDLTDMDWLGKYPYI